MSKGINRGDSVRFDDVIRQVLYRHRSPPFVYTVLSQQLSPIELTDELNMYGNKEHISSPYPRLSVHR
jgi:hypothetical protein